MKWRVLAMLCAGVPALAGALGCSSAAHDDERLAGGAAGISGVGNPSPGGGANAGGSASAGGGGVTEGGTCVERPAPQRTQGTLLSLSLKPSLTNLPFVFGQPNALADGGSLVALNLRFYVSDVHLLRSSGEPVAVDLVAESGVPEPYGVHLFNAEEADSATLRLLAPSGDYSGLSFALGIKLSCNQQPPAQLSDPLTDVSQMTWPHTGGFLFLRYEGRYTAGSAGASGVSPTVNIPPAVHMGGDIRKELVPGVSVSGTFSIPESGRLEKALNVAMDELFKGATADIDVSDVAVGLLSAPEAVAGERLRRQLSALHVFVFAP